MTTLSLALMLVSLAAAPPAADGEARSRPIDFSREIRPLLANYCFQCHGPDDKARKARLRLDQRPSATAELRSGKRAIVPGKPEESELLARLTARNELDVMPPPKLGNRPKAEEITTLRRWISQGAPYTTHWSYVPPVRPPPPG